MTVCIVDTSILVELLNVPGLASQHLATVEGFSERQRRREQFLLPLPVLFETGNPVSQVSDGRLRREKSEQFVEFARGAMDGKSPFAATPFPTREEFDAWLDGFPEHAMRRIGLVDRSLIALWETQRELHTARRIYIWALDEHLLAYDTAERRHA